MGNCSGIILLMNISVTFCLLEHKSKNSKKNEKKREKLLTKKLVYDNIKLATGNDICSQNIRLTGMLRLQEKDR